MKPETIKIDEVEYIRKDAAPQLDAGYVIVRGDRSGCFAGYLKRRDSTEIVLCDARRLWYWDGAASLSELEMSGTSKPENCKFPEPMMRVTILDAIEIIDCTSKAKKSIESVKIWKA